MFPDFVDEETMAPGRISPDSSLPPLPMYCGVYEYIEIHLSNSCYQDVLYLPARKLASHSSWLLL